MAAAVTIVAAACQTPLGQVGFDNANTSANPNETTLGAANVGSVVAKFDTDLTAYGTVTDLGEPVFGSDGNIIVTTDDEVVAVRPDGTVAWHTVIPDAHPEIDAPHIISVYGDDTTVDVQVDTKVQGAAPSYAGGYVVKLSNGTGVPTASENTFRPATPATAWWSPARSSTTPTTARAAPSPSTWPAAAGASSATRWDRWRSRP